MQRIMDGREVWGGDWPVGTKMVCTSSMNNLYKVGLTYTIGRYKGYCVVEDGIGPQQTGMGGTWILVNTLKDFEEYM